MKTVKMKAGRNRVNATQNAVATSGGLVLATGVGDLVIDLEKPSTVKFDTQGKIHVYPRAVTQTQPKSSERVFTTLDRPAPLSPEMLAIHRMQRKNEMAREQMRSEMEARYAEQEANLRAQIESRRARQNREDFEAGQDQSQDTVRQGKDTKAGDTEGRKPGKLDSKDGADPNGEAGDTPADVGK